VERYLTVAAALLLAISLLGCGTVPRTSIYTIDLPEAERLRGANPGAPALAVDVSSPRYLEQAFIAQRTSPYSLDISRYSKWDMAPDKLAAWAFKDALSKTGRFRKVETYNSAPPGHHELDVTLRNFELLDEGGASYALFSIEVVLSSPGEELLYSESFSKKTMLSERSFKGLARQLSLALDEALEGTRDGVLEALEAGD
jgi:uncharacterized lipoprotein YmbA